MRQTTQEKAEVTRKNMHQNWIQGNISSPMDTRSFITTLVIHAPIGKKLTRKQLPKLTQWRVVEQMWGGNKVNDMPGKR